MILVKVSVKICQEDLIYDCTTYAKSSLSSLAVGHFSDQLFRGHSLFMIKVGIVTVLVALPSLVRSSAGWAYQNKAIWTIIMAQLSFARHRGEVLFSLASRVIATCESHIRSP